MPDTAVRSTVDFEAQGKQFGVLQIPRSTNRSGWASLLVPIVCIANGSGSTAVNFTGAADPSRSNDRG